MKIEQQKMYIAVRPTGLMIGPCMLTRSDVETALNMGIQRTPKIKLSWRELGYKVIPCLVTPIEEFEEGIKP
jgi:hypothetical protein